jgi:hypothetical protein
MVEALLDVLNRPDEVDQRGVCVDGFVYALAAPKRFYALDRDACIFQRGAASSD